MRESGKKHSKYNLTIVWPWTVNVEGKGYYFKNMEEAVSFTKKQLSSGKSSIDVGCMQISLKHHPKAFESLEQAFTPQHNIDYGAQFLKQKYLSLGSWDKAIGHYHSGNQERAQKYRLSVQKIANNMDKYRHALHKHQILSYDIAPRVAFSAEVTSKRRDAAQSPVMLFTRGDTKHVKRVSHHKGMLLPKKDLTNENEVIEDIKVVNAKVDRYNPEEYDWFKKKKKAVKFSINNV
jgi:hypothetical protein